MFTSGFQSFAFQTVGTGIASAVSTVRPTGGWPVPAPRKTLWRVELNNKEYYFDTRDEALHFYDTGEIKKQAKRVKVIGKAKSISYAGHEISDFTINKRSGIDILRDATSALELERYISSIIEIDLRASLIAQEEEELLILAAALVA